MPKRTSRQASRKAGQATPAQPAKRVHALSFPGADTSDERPCWRFTHVDHDGPWGFGEVEPAVLRDILRHLGQFESMKLNEIFHSGGYPGKDYDVPGIPNAEALERIIDMKLTDQTKIWALRLGGRPRLYGFLWRNIFNVVWWVPEHDIHPSHLKHT